MKKLFRRWIPACAGMTKINTGMTIKIAGIIMALLFSLYLMFHTFSYDTNVGSPTVASKAWSDFGAHIPLIRSFSQGDNFIRLLKGQSIESPLYPYEPIRYHFGFYAMVGTLERIGVRLDYALNILSGLGFFLLLIAIFMFSYSLFTNTVVSLLSVLFFLYNGSLSFVRFFSDHPLSPRTLADIVANTKFPAFGPWDGGLISAFWTLNIYTNQRHLAVAYGISLCLLYVGIQNYTTKRAGLTHSIVIAIGMSILLFVHFPAAIMTTLFLLWFFLMKKNRRSTLFVAGLWSIPAFLFLTHMAHLVSPVTQEFGYLVQKPITIISFIIYWVYNIGLHMIFIPLGIILSPRPIRRVLVFPLLLLFIIPNILRVSPDMINNHKFFNFFMIIANMFSAYAVVWLWHFFQKQIGLIKHIGRISLMGIIFFLTLSGVIDLFPVIHDTRGVIADTKTQRDVLFFQTHTLPSDIVANSTWFYHPASIAGRPIFSGYTYFTWSYGYDQGAREQALLSIYQAKNIASLCAILNTHRISYIELSDKPEDYIKPNLPLWNTLLEEYKNPSTGLRVFKTTTICKNS